MVELPKSHPLIKGSHKVDYKVDGQEVYVGYPATKCYTYPVYDRRRKTLEMESFDFSTRKKQELFVSLPDVVAAGAIDDFFEACKLFDIPEMDIKQILATVTPVSMAV